MIYFSHLDKIGLNEAIPLRTWFERGFAGILHKSALERIWDKFLGGSVSLLVYVAVALVDTSKVALLGCQTTKEALRCLVSVSKIKMSQSKTEYSNILFSDLGRD